MRALYTGRYLKARIAIVRGKGKADKREDLKRLEAKKEADGAMRQKLCDLSGSGTVLVTGSRTGVTGFDGPVL